MTCMRGRYIWDIDNTFVYCRSQLGMKLSSFYRGTGVLCGDTITDHYVYKALQWCHKTDEWCHNGYVGGCCNDYSRAYMHILIVAWSRIVPIDHMSGCWPHSSSLILSKQYTHLGTHVTGLKMKWSKLQWICHIVHCNITIPKLALRSLLDPIVHTRCFFVYNRIQYYQFSLEVAMATQLV